MRIKDITLKMWMPIRRVLYSTYLPKVDNLNIHGSRLFDNILSADSHTDVLDDISKLIDTLYKLNVDPAEDFGYLHGYSSLQKRHHRHAALG